MPVILHCRPGRPCQGVATQAQQLFTFSVPLPNLLPKVCDSIKGVLQIIGDIGAAVLAGNLDSIGLSRDAAGTVEACHVETTGLRRLSSALTRSAN